MVREEGMGLRGLLLTGLIVAASGCPFSTEGGTFCGNWVTTPSTGEVCDDGNNLNGDGCSADCRSDETCGNAIVDVAAGENCDDGNNVDGDGCPADCRFTDTCGN